MNSLLITTFPAAVMLLGSGDITEAVEDPLAYEDSTKNTQ